MPLTKKPLRVAIADDSAIFRKVLKNILGDYDIFEIVGLARNGEEALELVEKLEPDALILDVEMPVMDGLTTLKKLKPRLGRTSVLMFSALTQDGAVTTFQALELGAFDFVTKPQASSLTEGLASVRSDLVPKLTFLHTRKTLRDVSQARSRPTPAPQPTPRPSTPPPAPEKRVAARMAALRPGLALRREVVALGISTGGPKALAQLMPALPADLGVGMLIVQHMPPVFTRTLAERLNETCPLEVSEGREGDEVAPGRVLIAPGGLHMVVRRAGARGEAVLAGLEDTPPENNCKPSVDVLFRSVVNVYGGHAVGVIMTGMGSDGARELKSIKEAGGFVIAQNEATCTVFGMPKKPVEEGLPDLVVPLDEIAPAIVKAVRTGR